MGNYPGTKAVSFRACGDTWEKCNVLNFQSWCVTNLKWPAQKQPVSLQTNFQAAPPAISGTLRKCNLFPKYCCTVAEGSGLGFFCCAVLQKAVSYTTWRQQRHERKESSSLSRKQKESNFSNCISGFNCKVQSIFLDTWKTKAHYLL